MATYQVSDGFGGTLAIICAATGPIVPSSCPTDGTHFMTRLFNLDSGAGAEYNLGFSLRLSASGGSVEAGTATNPLRTDPTGTTTQPVSGTVAATQSGAWTVQQGGSNWSVNVAQVGGASLALGQALMAASVPVAIASNQSALPVSQSGSWTVTLGAGTAVIGHVIVDSGTLAATQSGTWTVGISAAQTIAVTNAGTFAVQAAQSGTWTVVLAAGSAVIGHVIVDSGTITTVSTVTTVSTLTTITNPVTVVGQAASGASKAGNPVQTGAVFNTTQPTVTTGQVVEAQATARGAHIVATGVDAFNVTLSAGSAVIGHVIVDSGTLTAVTAITNALPAGTNVIGHVIVDSGTLAATQSGAWTVAATQSGTWNIGTVTTVTTVAAVTSITNVVHVDDNAGSLTVDNAGTFAVQAAQSGTWNIATVTAVTTVSTVTTVATVTSLSQWAGNAIATGAGTTTAGVLRVVLPTDQTAIPASQSGTWTVALSTGAAVIGGVTIADGSLATLGAMADAAATLDTSTASLISLTKRLLQRVTAFIGQLPTALTGKGNLKVALSESTATVTVGGTVATTAAVSEGNIQGPTVGDLAMGKTADTIPKYQPMPLAAGGASVVVSAAGSGVGVTIADGALVSLGAKADAPASVDAGTFSLIALFKRLLLRLPGLTALGNWKVSLEESPAVLTVAGSDYAWRNPQKQTLKVDAQGLAHVAVESEPQPVPASDRLTVATLGAPGTVDVATDGCSTTTCQATGTGSGLVWLFQGTNDNVNWTTLPWWERLSVSDYRPLYRSTGVSPGANGYYFVGCAGFSRVRVNLSAIASGAETFALRAGVGVQGVNVVTSSETIPASTTAPQTGVLVMGKTADFTPKYSAVPLAAAGTSVIISGGVDVGTLTTITNTVTVDTELPAAAALADGASNPTAPFVGAAGNLFNNTTWDRQRGNNDGVLLTNAARTASTNSANITNYNARGVMVWLNITAASGTGGLKVSIFGVDATSANTFLLAQAAAAITATGAYGYELYPGASSATPGTGNGYLNARFSGALPRVFFVQISHADGTSYTYSANYSLIL